MSDERTLVISDIHGCDQDLEALLRLCTYNPSVDKLILLGDYVDRGLRSRETVELVKRLVTEQGAIALQGNHDHRFVNVVLNSASGDELRKFFEKGGVETISSYLNIRSGIHVDELQLYIDRIIESYAEHIQFLRNLPYYYEDDHYIYVHAGLNPDYRNWRQQPERDFLYIREAFYAHDTVVDKTVIFGHTRTTELHSSSDVWFGSDKIGIDGGCAYGAQLNCLAIINGRIDRVYVQSAGKYDVQY